MRDALGNDRSYSTLPPMLAAQLADIEPSKHWDLLYRPCSVVLHDGSVQDCVYLVKAESYVKIWEIWPDMDSGKREVKLGAVKEIRDSPTRMPAQFANKIYAAGESGMGYTLFRIQYRDGTYSDHLAGGAVDFVRLVPGRKMADITDVIPHDADRQGRLVDCPEYAWCLFEK